MRFEFFLNAGQCSRFLTDRYQFEAVEFETTGAYSDGKRNIVYDIGRRLAETADELRETFWLIQIFSLAVQCDNAADIICGELKIQNNFGGCKSFKNTERF